MKLIKFGTITSKGEEITISGFHFDCEGEIASQSAYLKCIINELQESLDLRDFGDEDDFLANNKISYRE